MTTTNWRDLRITGSYIPVGASTPTSIDLYFILNGTPDSNGVTTGLIGTAMIQDATPTYTQASAGESGFNVISPVASDAFASIIGTHGQEESSDQPGEFTRLNHGTANGTIAHHIGCHRRGPYAGVNGPGAVTIAAPGMAAAGAGIVGMATVLGLPAFVIDEGAGVYGYYLFDRPAGNFARVATAWDPRPANVGTGVSSYVAQQLKIKTGHYLMGKLWMPSPASASSIKDVYSGTTVATDSAPYETVLHGDRLHVYGVSTAGYDIWISPYDINEATGVLTRTQNSVPANVRGSIKDETTLLGVVSSKGFMIAVCGRGIYSVEWDDTNKRYLTSQLDPLPLGATSNPIVFGQEVYVAAGSRLFRFKVGSEGNTWVPIDPGGALPTPYDGDIVQLVATYDGLYCRQVASDTLAALLRVDGGGAVSTIYWSDGQDNATGFAALAKFPFVPALGYGEPMALYPRPNGVTATVVMDSIVLPDITRNPRVMAAIKRQQLPKGILRWPFQYGVNRPARKTPLRMGIEVEDVGSSASLLTADIYFQRDYKNKSGVNTFASGPLRQTGTWEAIANVALESSGIDATTGHGIHWVELTDANGDYIACASRYAMAAIINGDVTGAKYPEIRSIIVERIEWVPKGYLSQFRIRLRVADGTQDDENATATFDDAAELDAYWRQLLALNDHGVIATIYPVGEPDSHAFKGVMTKLNCDVTHQEAGDGVTERFVQFSIQHVVPAGLYADVLSA